MIGRLYLRPISRRISLTIIRTSLQLCSWQAFRAEPFLLRWHSSVHPYCSLSDIVADRWSPQNNPRSGPSLSYIMSQLSLLPMLFEDPRRRSGRAGLKGSPTLFSEVEWRTEASFQSVDVRDMPGCGPSSRHRHSTMDPIVRNKQEVSTSTGHTK